MTQFAIKFVCKGTPKSCGIHLAEGTITWIRKGDFGPSCDEYKWEKDGRLGADLLLFNSVTEANEFMQTFNGHPWWYQLKSWEVVSVEPLYERVTGYKPCTHVCQTNPNPPGARP